MRKLKEIGIGAFRPDSFGAGGYRHRNTTAPLSDADTDHSRSSQRVNKGYDIEDDLEDEEDLILECRVYKNGKYCLVETLENIVEFNYADRFNSMISKLNSQKQKRKDTIDDLPSAEQYVKTMEEDNENENEDPLDEFSGAAAGGGGPAVPLGYTAKGKPETPAQRRERYRFNITKSYPYTSLAKPPRSTKKRRKKRK